MPYTYNTGNPVGANGSTDPRDLIDNAQVIDQYATATETTAPDRLGVTHKTWAGLESDVNTAIATYTMFTARGDWTTATAYALNDVWTHTVSGDKYLVLDAYTSGASEDVDIASGNVTLFRGRYTELATSLAELSATPVVFEGQAVDLTAGGRSGQFIWTLGDFSAEVAADTLQGVYVASDTIAATVGCWARNCKLDNLVAEWFGATDGDTIGPAILAAIDRLPSGGGIVSFFGNYSDISSDIRVMRGKVKIIGTGWNRLTFLSGFGLYLGESTSTSGAKTGTKVVEIGLESFQVTGETDYNGTLTTFDYADQITTVNFISSPININTASGSLCTGLEVKWVQWWWDYSGTYGGNHRGIFYNFTATTPNNEDHYHLYGTRIYVQKGLITGEVASSIHAKFANDRITGASEVSFNGCHIAEFASGDNSNVYGFSVDLDGNSVDKKVFRSVKFNSCMIEQSKYMFDVATLNAASAGKDTSNYVFGSCYFVGNSYRTDVLFKADSFKARATLRDCNASSITTLFDGIRCKFEGSNDFSPYTTFSTNSYTTHDFIGTRPITGFRTKRNGNFILPAGDTTYILTHGLIDTPGLLQLQLGHNSTWWVSAKNSTTITIEFGTASGSNSEVRFFVDIPSTQ